MSIMENYTAKFENDYVSISDNGVILTRSRYPYKQLNFSEIKEITIRDGYLIKNRTAVLAITISAVIAWGLFLYNLNIIPGAFTGNSAGTVVFWLTRPGLAVIVVTLAMAFMLYQSFVRCKIVDITTANKRYQVRVPELKDDAEAEYLQRFVTAKITG